MHWVRSVCSLVHAIRKKEKIGVRQPLRELVVWFPSTSPDLIFNSGLSDSEMQQLICDEVNVQKVHLGEFKFPHPPPTPRAADVRTDEKMPQYPPVELPKKQVPNPSDYVGFTRAEAEARGEKVEPLPEHWKVANSGSLYVALDTQRDGYLRAEKIFRDLRRHVQSLRKEGAVGGDGRDSLNGLP